MTHTSIRAALAGISGVHVTPYGVDGGINKALMARVVDRIAVAGIHNIVSAGNTGEYYALTPDEVRVVHDVAIEANAGRSKLTAAVGRSLKEAVELGKRAKAGGADAIMAHQPMDPFAAPQAQAAYFRTIADEVDLPLVAYVRSDAMSLKDLLGIANHPNVAGVKFATTNLMMLAEAVRSSGPSRRCGSAASPRAGPRRSMRWARAASRQASSMSTRRVRSRSTRRSSRAISTVCATSSRPSPASRRCARSSATARTSPSSRRRFR